ncbi:FtsN Cell division protein [Burkholderiaceae bacterium]
MRQQQGGTLLGFILGLIVGLAVALVVAVYVTKVPIPFMNKAQSRNAEQDAAEVKKNKDWDPNAPLYGKNPAKPAAPAEPTDAAPTPATPAVTGAGASAEDKKTDDPLGDLARAKAGADPFVYFVQAGAYRSEPEAQAQKAKLALKGMASAVSEREQDGRTVYRVRLGPFDSKDDAEGTKKKLDSAKIESALVRVQR